MYFKIFTSYFIEKQLYTKHSIVKHTLIPLYWATQKPLMKT